MKKTIRHGMAFFAAAALFSLAISCASSGKAVSSKGAEGGTKSQEAIDQSIQFEGKKLNEYGSILAFAKELKVKADTSTSIVVDWQNEKKVAVENPTAKEVQNIVYKTGVQTDGKDKGKPIEFHMDILYQEKGEAQPVILFIPGGGFIFCDPIGSLRNERLYLAEHGYAVAAIEYHVVGNGFYTDAVQDVRDAINYLKENAEKYNLDTSRLALMGNSAGGYMTALVTAMDSTDIQASIDLYGLSDLTKVGSDFDQECFDSHHTPYSSESQYVNGVYSGKSITDDLEKAAKANPLSYIDGNECPMLIMHGDNDMLVSSSQSLLVHNALNKAGVSSTRYSLVGAGHGFGGFDTEPALKVITDFLAANVK